MNRNLEIVYFIYSTGKANGGHYRSLVVTAETMSAYHNVRIIVIGSTYSEVIKKSLVPSEFIYFNGINIPFTLYYLAKSILTRRCILHAYDVYSYFFARILSYFRGNPVLLTKCGGSNPKGYFPRFDNLIVFSKENYSYFKSEERYKDGSIYLIPNRVQSFECSGSRIRDLRNELGFSMDDKVILRIGRISKIYEKSLRQSINLLNYFLTIDDKYILIIIGNVQDQELHAELLHSQPKNIRIVTDDRYTMDAKELIDMADYVVGTGRGFMEAASKSKILFAPSDDGNLPTLITPSNFDDAFNYNFSERIKFKSMNSSENKKNILRTVYDEEYNFSLRDHNKRQFDHHFSIDKSVTKYQLLYSNMALETPTRDLFDVFRHFLFLIKAVLGLWYTSFKKTKYKK